MNERGTADGRKFKADDYRGRPVLSAAHQAGDTGRGVRRTPQSHARLARPECRRRWLGDDPSGIRTVVNDAVAVYFADAAIASAFVARWCAGHKAETADGLFRVRADEPA